MIAQLVTLMERFTAVRLWADVWKQARLQRKKKESEGAATLYNRLFR